MAVTNHSSNNATLSKAASVSVTLDTVVNDKIIVCTSINSNNTVSGTPAISDTVGSTYTKVPGSPLTNGTGLSVEMWEATAAGTNASNSITVNFSAKSTGVVCVGDYAGWKANGATNTATGSSTTPDIAIVPPQMANSWAIAAVGVASSGTFTANIGNLRQSNVVSSIGGALNDRPGDKSTGGTSVYGTVDLENKVTDSTTGAWACIALELTAITNTIKCDYQVEGTIATATSITSGSGSTTSGDTIVVTIGVASNQAVQSITDSLFTSYSFQVGLNNGTGQRIEVWAGKATSSGTNSVTVNMTTSDTFGFTAVGYSGVASLGNTATNSATGSPASWTVTITTQDSNNVMAGGIITNQKQGTTPPDANKGDQRITSGSASFFNTIMSQDDNSASAASVTVSGTFSPAAASYTIGLLELRTGGVAKPLPTRNLLGVGM